MADNIANIESSQSLDIFNMTAISVININDSTPQLDGAYICDIPDGATMIYLYTRLNGYTGGQNATIFIQFGFFATSYNKIFAYSAEMSNHVIFKTPQRYGDWTSPTTSSVRFWIDGNTFNLHANIQSSGTHCDFYK